AEDRATAAVGEGDVGCLALGDGDGEFASADEGREFVEVRGPREDVAREGVRLVVGGGGIHGALSAALEFGHVVVADRDIRDGGDDGGDGVAAGIGTGGQDDTAGGRVALSEREVPRLS